MAHQAIFFNQGQVCTAGSRTFVHEDIYDEFVTRAVKLAAEMKVENPMSMQANFGAVVSCLMNYI